MAIINRLAVDFDYPKIADCFDFFQLTTSEKYIPRGAYLLDKPQAKLHALSLVFDNGQCAFVMFSKGTMTRSNLTEQIGDERIAISSLHPTEIKNYILLRLFLYSLGNYVSQDNIFNNLTGKLYLHQPEFVSKNGKSVMALAIDIDKYLCINAEATTFTALSLFKGKEYTKLLSPDFPKYILEPNGKLRRSLVDDSVEKLYVKRGIPGKRAEYPFMSLKPDVVQKTKAFYVFDVINSLKKRYKDLISIKFDNILKQQSIGTRLDEDFIDKAKKRIVDKRIVLIDLVNDDLYRDDFLEIVDSLSQSLGRALETSNAIEEKAINIVYLHAKDYYSSEEIDPYASLPRDEVIQCITVEEGANRIINDSLSVINTIIKEIAIKVDLIEGYCSLDDWSLFEYNDSWYFGTEFEKQRYFLEVRPDGKLVFHDPLPFGGFQDAFVASLNEEMDGCDAKSKTIIANDVGDVSLIGRTSMFCLPNPDIFQLTQISRSKEARNSFLEGVVDINLFADGGSTFYNSGLIGSGMNTGIPHASTLYSIDIIRGKNIIPQLLKTMSVMFVKYNAFTVLPYPVKYLREHIATIKPTNHKK